MDTRPGGMTMDSRPGGEGGVRGLGATRAARLRRALVAVFALLIALPLVQQATGWPPDARLFGVEFQPQKPRLGRHAWFDGSFTRDFDAWYTAKIGLRGFLVKLGNQARYLIFRQPAKSTGTQVLIGRDHWLYDWMYLLHYQRRPGMRQDQARAFARDLGRIQRRLARRGVAFALVISPSKPEIYPEHLPRGMKRPAGTVPPKNAYETLLPELAAAGVRVVDAHADFLLWHAAEPAGPPLFPKTGTHWNNYGSYRCANRLLQRVDAEEHLGIDLPPLTRVRYEPASGSDLDLLELLNLFWFAPGGLPLSPLPVVAESTRPADRRLDVLIVGDSFSYNLVCGLYFNRAVRSVEYLNYFNQGFAYRLLGEEPGGAVPRTSFKRAQFKRDALDLRELMLSKQLVVLESNEILLSARGWGFPAMALAGLRRDKGRETRAGSGPPSR